MFDGLYIILPYTQERHEQWPIYLKEMNKYAGRIISIGIGFPGIIRVSLYHSEHGYSFSYKGCKWHIDWCKKIATLYFK